MNNSYTIVLPAGGGLSPFTVGAALVSDSIVITSLMQYAGGVFPPVDKMHLLNNSAYEMMVVSQVEEQINQPGSI